MEEKLKEYERRIARLERVLKKIDEWVETRYPKGREKKVEAKVPEPVQEV